MVFTISLVTRMRRKVFSHLFTAFQASWLTSNYSCWNKMAYKVPFLVCVLLALYSSAVVAFGPECEWLQCGETNCNKTHLFPTEKGQCLKPDGETCGADTATLCCAEDNDHEPYWAGAPGSDATCNDCGKDICYNRTRYLCTDHASRKNGTEMLCGKEATPRPTNGTALNISTIAVGVSAAGIILILAVIVMLLVCYIIRRRRRRAREGDSSRPSDTTTDGTNHGTLSATPSHDDAKSASNPGNEPQGSQPKSTSESGTNEKMPLLKKGELAKI